MDIVTLSASFRIEIPATVREQLDLRPGQRLPVQAFDGRIEIVPERSMDDLRGFLKGIDATVALEDDREM